MTRLRSLEYKWIVAVIFVIGLFMDLLDTTIVNVALPTLGTEFHVTRTTTLEWVLIGYLLSLAIWIPASGWLGDRFGTKKIFILALVAFTVGSALCGEAWSIGSLIAFRIIQGIGGGMLTPVGTAMLFRAFPPEERAKASSVLAIPVAIAPTIGPIIGGLLVDQASWRWIFRVNIPIGILGVILAVLYLREHTEPDAGRFDLPGFVLTGLGLPLVLYALSVAPHDGWTSTKVLATGLGGLALLAVMVVVELRVEQPMLALRLLADRMFRSANIVYFMTAAGLIGVLFLLPLFLQQLRGLSATESGLTTFTQALGVIAIARFASRIYPEVGPRRMLFAGMLITTIGTSLFLWVDLETSLWWIRGLMFFRGVGFGLTIIPLQAAAFSTIKSHDTGRASAIFNTNRQVASSVGVAILATVLADRGATHVAEALRGVTDPAAANAAVAHGTLQGFHDAYLAAVVMAAIGTVFTLLIHDEDAAASMAAAQHGEPQAAMAH
ncbi:MAG TPA: MDR family MFS transporter [Thermomicrobiales bacterium]|nr:MDR family MFS transporter [Thermomicrobiales bacterium]